jgi:hypothetical protein
LTQRGQPLVGGAKCRRSVPEQSLLSSPSRLRRMRFLCAQRIRQGRKFRIGQFQRFGWDGSICASLVETTATVVNDLCEKNARVRVAGKVPAGWGGRGG